MNLLNRIVALFNRVALTFGVNGPDVARRAIKTFVQAAAGVLTLDTADVLSLDTWQAAAVAGAAAVWSLIQNTVVIPQWDKRITADH
jgi:protein involved in polysaccharide export with SLBB domain